MDINVNIHWFLWISILMTMDLFGYPFWYPLISLDINFWYSWIFMEIHFDIHGFPRIFILISMDFYGNPCIDLLWILDSGLEGLLYERIFMWTAFKDGVRQCWQHWSPKTRLFRSWRLFGARLSSRWDDGRATSVWGRRLPVRRQERLRLCLRLDRPQLGDNKLWQFWIVNVNCFSVHHVGRVDGRAV